MSVNWADVCFFVAACRAGTLSGAARELAVDQSTVSRRLTALEKTLGVRLFDRTPAGLLLTAEGEKLRDAGANVEKAVLDFERLARRDEDRPEGTVRLSTNDAVASGFLVRRLGQLRERYPDIHFELVIGRAPVDLGRSEADLALRIVFDGTPPGEPSLVARRLADVAFAIYGSRDYLARRGLPQSPEDLTSHDFLSFSTSWRQPGAKWISEHVGQPKSVMQCETMVSMLAGTTGGLGLGVLFCFLADQEPNLVRVLGPVEHAGLWLTVHPDIKDKPRIRAAIEALSAIVKENAVLFSGDAADVTRQPAARGRAVVAS